MVNDSSHALPDTCDKSDIMQTSFNPFNLIPHNQDPNLQMGN
jgi:hypothetical protein